MGDNYPTLKLAAIQASPVFLDREATVSKACELICDAGKNGADVIGFPECFIAGFPYWYKWHVATSKEAYEFYKEFFKNSVVIPSDATNKLCEAAKEANSCVVIGLNEKEKDRMGTVYNTQLFIDRTGNIIGKHRKIMPTFYERLVHAGGDGSTLQAFDTHFGKIGGLICGENTNSLARYTLLAKGELIHVASWPAYPTLEDQSRHEAIDVRCRCHAWEGKIFVISSTNVFDQKQIDTLCKTGEDRRSIVNEGGHSCIIGPTGRFIARASTFGEEIIYAEASIDEIIHLKQWHDVVGHYNRFDIFHLTVNGEPLKPIHGFDE